MAGGVAEYFGIDATLVRVGFIVFCFVCVVGLVAYLALALLIPSAEPPPQTGADVTLVPDETPERQDIEDPGRRHNLFAWGLGGLGVLILLSRIDFFDFFAWTSWSLLAVVLVGAGVLLMTRRSRGA